LPGATGSGSADADGSASSSALSTYGAFAPGHDDKRQRCATYVVI